MSKGSKPRPFDAGKFASGYDQINWSTKKNNANGTATWLIVVCQCGQPHRVKFDPGTSVRTWCAKCRKRLML